MQNNLRNILYKCGLTDVRGTTDVTINNICFDSRKVGKGDLFVAVKGTQADGHLFITKAVGSGAKAVLCETFPKKLKEGVTYVQVGNSAKALGIVASNYFNNPSAKLRLTGVTGTNGKTSVATLLFRLFRKLGYNTGLLSTVQNQINEEVIPATHTTPDPVHLNSLLNGMVEQNCTHCFMEVSSHAIHQERIAGLEFAGGIFTNITHDHLDYHETFKAYIKAKKAFFDNLGRHAFALINKDDKNSKVMVQNTPAKIYSFGLKSVVDFKARILENTIEGLVLNIDGEELYTKLIGEFNAYNILSVYAAAILLGEEKQEVLTALSTLKAAEGRFDYYVSKNRITGIIDYAHTPDALKQVLKTIKGIHSEGQQIITVVGCGGDRDKEKRPEMAAISANMSDRVILTSDNPRSEDPEQIIRDMEKGVSLPDRKKVMSIANRKEAIKAACSFAMPGDIILIAGKGHEKYQEVKGVKHPFDDRQVLIEMFELMVN